MPVDRPAARAACLILTLLLAPAAIAAPPVSPPVVVTATRSAVPAAEALAPVAVIDRATIEASGARDLPELLRRYAGLELGRNGGPGQATSVFIRGAESNHTLVLVDGVKINPGTIGGAALQHIDPSVVERIEIVKGPRSTLYGSDAIGGVIQIFTRPAARGHARLQLGTDRWRGLAVGFGQAGQRSSVGLQVSGVRTDGFPARVEADRDSGYRNTTVNAHASHQGARWRTTLRHWQARGMTEYFSYDLRPLSQDHDNAVTSLTLEGPWGQRGATTLRLSQAQDRIVQNDGPDFATTRRSVLDWQYDHDLGDGGLWTAGLVLTRQTATALSFGTALEERLDNRAAYSQWQGRRGRHQWLAGLRWLDHDAFGTHGTWDLAYGYHATPGLLLRAAAGTGFRAPDATDRFGYGGNPDLRPERSRNLELGLRYRLDAHRQVEVNLFQNRIDDLISFYDPDGFLGPVPGRNQNIDAARIRGLEASFRYRRGPWRFRLEGLLQDPENLRNGAQLARRAKRGLNATLDYDRGRFRGGVELQARSARPDSDFSSVVNAGYTLVHGYAAWRLSPDWWLRARVENLFDRDYTLADRFNTRGRALFVSLDYRGGGR